MADLSDQDLRIIRTAPMFSALSDEAIRSLAAHCLKIMLHPQEAIFRPDEEANDFFVILRGHVRVYKLSPEGNQQVLHLFGPGQTVAEAAAMKMQDYPAHAEAVDAVTLLAIDKATFDAAVRENVDMVAGLVTGLSDKLKELAGLAEQLALRKVPARLANALLQEMTAAASLTFTLSMAKKDIAEQIGTTPETLSRTLRSFQDDGVIDVQGRTITVLNVDVLNALATGQA
ncbi:MAG: cyclic nucleotide-binding domain-containing protein [Planctomycetes bacterium]|jgi:CRP/FNR family transcriptional regulator|nr:Crp/Fnr family transcriptional regulator [Phycisphaerae bacterium]NBB95311.1 cyclic nucleotide-binding domain-containing protein [Planctomycetota bacterium]